MSSGLDDDGVKRYSKCRVLRMNHFDTLLGSGAFGPVFLGTLPNGAAVAVKILGASSRQGDPEFLNEVNLLRRANHGNLVRLVGFCEEHDYKVLIYEYAEEGSLHDHLYGTRSRLDWRQRLTILVQSSRGLEYLHNGCCPTIYHRDIKSANILLTRGMGAKVADFGISKDLGSHRDDEANNDRTHISTMVKGTVGYLDPRYLVSGHLTDKADVYSFGVLILEVIYGRKPIQGSESIVDWVKENPRALPDDFFASNYDRKAMGRVIKVAKECTQPSREDRPDMKKVVQEFEKAHVREFAEKKSFLWLRNLRTRTLLGRVL